MIRAFPVHRRVLATLLSLALVLLLSPVLLLNRLRTRRGAVTRVLLLEPWGIGDLVLATGALRSLRAAYPAARLVVLSKGYARPLLLETGLVDEVVAYDFPWTAFTDKYRLSRYRWRELFRLVLRLRRERFDLALNAREDVRNNVLMTLAGARRSVSLACGTGDLLVSDVVDSPGVDAHRVDDWAAVTARALGSRPVESMPSLTLQPAAIEEARRRLTPDSWPPGPVIGIHPGARIAVRRWSLEGFAAVADALAERHGARIVVFADPDGYGSQIPMRHEHTLVRGSLAEMMATAACCDLVVCNDSGPMHVIAALGVPLVAVFGPMREEWFGPRGPAPRTVVQVEDVACRPCFDICRFAEAHCLTRIAPERVTRAASALLGDASHGAPVRLEAPPVAVRR